jgi:hypothetical protein
MKISDVDTTKESVQMQEFVDNVRSLLNNGGFEIEMTAGSDPGTAPQETKIVISLFGAQYRVYISYLGEWYYATLTKL